MIPKIIGLPLLVTLILTACGGPKDQSVRAPEGRQLAGTEISEERGAYLVNAIGCADCHSPKIMTDHGPEPDPERHLSGYPAGQVLPPYDLSKVQGYALFSMDLTAAVGPWGTSFASNITPDETGIGNWSEEQFLLAMKEGQWRGLASTRKLLPPMPWMQYRNLSEGDLKSIFAYLKTIKPVKNVVPLAVPPAGA